MRYEPAGRLLRLAWKLSQSTVGLTLEEMRAAMPANGEASPSRSTAERAKRVLEETFPFECVNPDEPGEKRWRIRNGSLAGLIAFGADDLAALGSAAALCARERMPAQAKALDDIRAKLAAAQPRAAAAKLESDEEAIARAEGIAHRPGPRTRVDPEVFETLRHAIKAMRQVRLTYRARGTGRTSRQRVSPLGIVYGSRNYLLAFNHNREVRAIRSFALPNVAAAELLEWSARRPPSFTDIRSYTRDWFGVYEQPAQDIVLRFRRRAAPDAREFVFHPSQTMSDLPGGALEVRFRAGGLREIAWHLMTWGDTVEVLAPRALRTLVANGVRR
jgi:predicted DNA-binding transcriptional regulator YafY